MWVMSKKGVKIKVVLRFPIRIRSKGSDIYAVKCGTECSGNHKATHSL